MSTLEERVAAANAKIITTGDRVKVEFEHTQTFYGYVRSIPQQTGECWIIDGDDGVHYVQTFSQIIKEL